MIINGLILMVVGLLIVFIFLMILITTLSLTAKIVSIHKKDDYLETFNENEAKLEAIKLAVKTYIKEKQ